MCHLSLAALSVQVMWVVLGAGAVPSQGVECHPLAESKPSLRLRKPRAMLTGVTQPAKCHLTEKRIRSGLTSPQPKYSPAVFPTGDASRMESESRRDMIRNRGLI